MDPKDLLAIVEAPRDALTAAYEADAKSDASCLAKALASLVSAIALSTYYALRKH